MTYSRACVTQPSENITENPNTWQIQTLCGAQLKEMAQNPTNGVKESTSVAPNVL